MSKLLPLILVGAGVYYVSTKDKKPTKKAAKKLPPQAPQAPSPTPPSTQPVIPLSPFVQGSNCTTLLEQSALEYWLANTVDTAIREVFTERVAGLPGRIEDPAVAWSLADDVAARSMEPCTEKGAAYATAYKMVWCSVMTGLAISGRVDEEIYDITQRCVDPAFDPFNARPIEPAIQPPPRGPDGSPTPPIPQPDGSLPTPPIPQPDSSFPTPPPPGPDSMPPFDPSLPDPVTPPPPPPQSGLTIHDADPTVPPMPPPATSNPPNMRQARTREQISESTLMRMVDAGDRQGQTRARPRTVALAVDPEWEHADQAIAALQHFARAHPDLTFYVVSMHDTQRHYGVPQALGALRYILSSANDRGFASRDPIIGNQPPQIHPAQWERVIAFAKSTLPVSTASSSSTSPRTVSTVREAPRRSSVVSTRAPSTGTVSTRASNRTTNVRTSASRGRTSTRSQTRVGPPLATFARARLGTRTRS